MEIELRKRFIEHSSTTSVLPNEEIVDSAPLIFEIQKYLKIIDPTSFNYFFPFIQRIEGEHIYLATTAFHSDPVVIKHSSMSMKEAAVALLKLNALRREIPNFGLVFGYFNSFPKMKFENGGYCLGGSGGTSSYTFPSSSTGADYSIQEYIEGRTLSSLLPHLEKEELEDVMKCIYYALQIANEEFGFTHYDLKPDNIVVRILEEKVSINYRGRVVNTKYIPVIIDYELSSFRVGATYFGLKSYQTFVSPIPNFGCDYFKISLTVYHCLMRNLRDGYGKMGLEEIVTFKEKAKRFLKTKVPLPLLKKFFIILPPDYYSDPKEVVAEVEEVEKNSQLRSPPYPPYEEKTHHSFIRMYFDHLLSGDEKEDIDEERNYFTSLLSLGIRGMRECYISLDLIMFEMNWIEEKCKDLFEMYNERCGSYYLPSFSI